MRGNLGTMDRAIRLAIGLVMMGVGFGAMDGGGGVAVGVIGVVVALTGATGCCLLYVPFNFNTHGVR
jgi:hypothetical protein